MNFCLGQVNVESKSNEIPAVRELLDILQLKGAVVTADAMHCQKETAQKIIAALRRFSLSILKSDTTIKDNVRGKRLLAGWNLDNLKGILLGFQAT